MPVPPLRLEQINIVVRDMPRSVAFYRLLDVSIDEVPAEWAAWASEGKLRREKTDS